MKTKLIPLAVIFGLAGGLLYAQDGGAANGGPPPSPPHAGSAGFKAHLLPPGAVERLELTADQYQQVLTLEADVNERLGKILTAQQIQMLERMRGPGHRGGPGGFGGPSGHSGPAGPGSPGGPGGDGGNRPPPPGQ